MVTLSGIMGRMLSRATLVVVVPLALVAWGGAGRAGRAAAGRASPEGGALVAAGGVVSALLALGILNLIPPRGRVCR